MATTLAGQIVEDRDNAFLDDTGFVAESVSYRVASTGASVTIDAVVESAADDMSTRVPFSGLERVNWKKFTISAAAANGVASPQPGDQVTHDGQVWTVTNVTTIEGMHELRATSPQAVS